MRFTLGRVQNRTNLRPLFLHALRSALVDAMVADALLWLDAVSKFLPISGLHILLSAPL